MIDDFYMNALIVEAAKMEQWKANNKNNNWKVKKFIRGYNRRYMICRNGLVYNRQTESWLKPQQHKNGYLYVCLYIDGKKKNVYLHRLIAEYFVTNPNGFDVVYHLDGNKLNNRAENIGRISKSLLQRDYDPYNPPSIVKTLKKPRTGKNARAKEIRPEYLERLHDLQAKLISLPKDSPERKEALLFLRQCWANARAGLPVPQ